MREFWVFLKAVWLYWWTLMSSAFFTLIGIFSATTNQSNAWISRASFTVAVLMLFAGCYLAWRDEYRKNITGPLVLLRWRSIGPVDKDRLIASDHDKIEVLNQGTAIALQVVVEDFSLPEFRWSFPIEIPHLDPGTTRVVQADFYRWVDSYGQKLQEIGYLRHILLSMAPATPLSITVRYRNLQGTSFRRTFVLRWVGVGRTGEIECYPEKLETKR